MIVQCILYSIVWAHTNNKGEYMYIKVTYPDGEVEYWPGWNAKEVLRLQKIHNNKIVFTYIKI